MSEKDICCMCNNCGKFVDFIGATGLCWDCYDRKYNHKSKVALKVLEILKGGLRK